MNRRNLLIGLMVAPAIVRPTSIMPIFSIDDWNPHVLGLKLNGGGWLESSFNFVDYFSINENTLWAPLKRLSYLDIVNNYNILRNSDISPIIDNERYKIVRKSDITLPKMRNDYVT